MENYTKGENVIIEADWNIAGCTDATTRLEITPSIKVRGIITIALEKFKSENQILLIGAGPAVVKVISTVEIVKKRIKHLHQITQLGCKRVDEYWDPKLDGLDRLKVTREIPAIAILLSKDSLDASSPGYQAPDSTGEKLWLNETQPKKKRPSNKPRNDKRRVSDKNHSTSENKDMIPRNGVKKELEGKPFKKRNNYEMRMANGNSLNGMEKEKRQNIRDSYIVPHDNKEE